MRGAIGRCAGHGLAAGLIILAEINPPAIAASTTTNGNPFEYELTDDLVIGLARQEAAISDCILRTEFVSQKANAGSAVAYQRCVSVSSSSRDLPNERSILIARGFLAEFNERADRTYRISDVELASLCGSAPSLLLSQIVKKRTKAQTYKPAAATMIIGSIKVQTPANMTCFASAAEDVFLLSECAPAYQRFRLYKEPDTASSDKLPPARSAICAVLNN